MTCGDVGGRVTDHGWRGLARSGRVAVGKAKSAEIEKFERKKAGVRTGVRHVS